MTEPRIIGREKTLADAMACGVPLVVTDDDGRIVGVVGDTELREAMLLRASPTTSIADVLDPDPIVCSESDAVRRAGEVFSSTDVEQIVVADADGRPLRVLRRGEIAPEPVYVDTAILMVGGEGKRLRPLTADVPKPLLPVAGKPILERIVTHLAAAGVKTFWMALGYKADQIEAYFGDGARFGVEIRYLREPKPLGTAGAVGTAPIDPGRPVLVMNGDILTDLDVSALIRHHRRDDACLTMAARSYQHRVPYGVLRLLDRRVVSLEEKPTHFHWTNAGIYVIAPRVIARIPKDTYTDMTVLIDELLKSGEKITAFPIREYWCDIGQPEDYERANRQWAGR